MSIIKTVRSVMFGVMIVFVGLVLYNMSNANELIFSGYSDKIIPNTRPSEPDVFNQYCWYPIEIRIDSDGKNVMSADAKFFHSGISLTGFQTGAAFPNYYSFEPLYYRPGNGISQFAQGIYPSSSPYTYVNAYVDLSNQTGDVIDDEMLVRVFFKNYADIDDGELVFYFINGTGDDSNIQSGVENAYENVITSVVDREGLEFVKRPCILDTDEPLFTGYTSGSTLNFFTDDFIFTVYDWTGNNNIPQQFNADVINSTFHYYFSGSDYLQVTGSVQIDNQMGVDTGCVQVTVVGTTHNGFTGQGVFPSTNLLGLTVFTASVLDGWITTYAGEGDEETRTGNTRGYSYTTGFVTLSDIEDNQDITVTIVACDYLNQNDENNTGTITFSITLTGFDKVPPYLTSAVYSFVALSGGNDEIVEIPAGFVRSSDLALVSGWTLWTSGIVDLFTTGSEEIVIVTGTIDGTLSAYLPQSLPLLASDPAYSVFKHIPFDGNYLDGTFEFIDNPPYISIQGANTGYTYLTGGEPYTDTFYFDVFWIDQAAPDVLTGTLQDEPSIGKTTLLLTGQNVGHDDSVMDDEFIILAFSGVVSPDLEYSPGYDSGEYSLYHTGIIFLNPWEGCILVRDRAGNQVCIEINILISTREMRIKALPEQRVQDFGFDADINFWFATSVNATNYTDSGTIVLNENGTGSFTINVPADGDDYLVLLKGHGYLSIGYTGDFDAYATEFDFTTGTNGLPDWIKIFGVPNVSALYPGDRTLIVWGDVASGANDTVNSLDLATINDNLTVDFTVAPQPLRVGGPEDDYVTAQEQAVLILNNARQGYWKEYFPAEDNPWSFLGY